jgi:hypothetical protein
MCQSPFPTYQRLPSVLVTICSYGHKKKRSLESAYSKYAYDARLERHDYPGFTRFFSNIISNIPKPEVKEKFSVFLLSRLILCKKGK